MERVAIPNILILFASLSLWTMAFQATREHAPERTRPMASALIAQAGSFASNSIQVLVSHEREVRNGLVGEKLLESGMPITAAASGHWF